MTAQVPDTVVFQHECFDLIAFDPAQPFEPERDLGIKSEMINTACWRGFWCEYEILEGNGPGFLLRELSIRSATGEYPSIDGIAPASDPHGPAMVYSGLKRLLRYSGRLRIGKDFQREWYVHMGFQEAHAYGVVKELSFENGRVITQRDLSEEMAKTRRLKRGARRRHRVVEWIKRRFSWGIG